MGIDVGATVGLAILDAKGNLLHLWSKKNVKRGQVIKEILRFGKPILLASDVNPLPKYVEKLASSLGCSTFYPEKPLSMKEKSRIVERLKLRVKDVHQRDALTSALRAFKRHRALFLKIEEELKKRNELELFDEVVQRVFKKGSESIIDAIRGIEIEKRRKV